MDQQKTALLQHTYQRMLMEGLVESNADGIPVTTHNNITGFGTTVDEKVLGIKDLQNIIRRQKEQADGLEMKWEITPFAHTISDDENTAFFADDIHFTVDLEDQQVNVQLRFSLVFCYQDGEWKAMHFHSSKPEYVQSEEDTFGVDTWKQKAEELELQVQERTADIVEKNRALEIESSLERVRSAAMSIQTGEDLLGVCKVMYAELQALGFGHLRCTLIHIFQDNATYYTDYDYADITGGKIVDVPYKGDAKVEAFFNRIRRSTDAFEEVTFTGTELENFKAHRKKTGQVDDPRLDTATTLYYYFYSIGLGNIGICTFAPIDSNELPILKRFRNVFDLAYKRYFDVTKAEAQARETQVQLSLEKVRARTMAMQRSEELGEVASELFKQMQQLVPGVWSSGFVLCEKDRGEDEWWFSTDKGFTRGFMLPNKGDYAHQSLYEGFLKNEPCRVVTLEGKQLREHYDWLMGIEVSRKIFEEMDASGVARPGYQQLHAAYFSMGYLAIITTTPCNEDEIFVRFAKVFDLVYTRFLDLQKAEAQAREAHVQLGLERVRAATMSMQTQNDLLHVIDIFGSQLVSLGLTVHSASFIQGVTKGDWELWLYSPTEEVATVKAFIPFKEIAYFTRSASNVDLYLQHGKEIQIKTFTKEEKDEFQEHYFQHAPVPIPTDLKTWIYDQPGSTIIDAFLENVTVSLLKYDLQPYEDEEIEIFRRFSYAFKQAYTRFLDLQKAEAQAREAQIEAALERVRSRTMAMHRTSELQEVIHAVHKELLHLNLPIVGGSFVAVNADVGPDLRAWGAGGTADTSVEVLIPHFDLPIVTGLISGINAGPGFFTEAFSREEKIDFFTRLFSQEPWAQISSEQQNEVLQSDGGYTRSVAVSQHTSIIIINQNGIDFSPAENDILRRMARVFEQAYVRFLDIKKSEAQTREAQIQLALERVRARTMAMQHSDELPLAATLLFQQIQSLGMPTWSAGYNILSADKKSSLCIMSSEGEIQQPFTLPLSEHESMIPWYNGVLSEEDFVVYEQGGEALKEHYRYLKSLPELNQVLQELEDAGIALPTYQINHLAKFNHGFLLFITYEPVPEAHGIFKRFAKVFEQTYTRFLDLQKAEAQAREAQIEAALERVRSRTMAMQKSSELNEVASVLFTQIRQLGGNLWGTGFGLCNIDKEFDEFWFAGEAGVMPPVLIPHTKDPVHIAMYEGWKNNASYYVIDKSGEALREHYRYLLSLPGIKEFFQPMLTAGIGFPDWQQWHAAFFSKGYLLIITLEPYLESETLIRFANVFEQTYTRFLDLQKAEGQAREAQVEAALEKVRSRSLAMHRSDEMNDVVVTLFEKLRDLNITDTKASAAAINIYIPGSKDLDVFVCGENEAGLVLNNYHFPYFKNSIADFLDDARAQAPAFLERHFSSEEKNTLYEHLFAHTALGNLPADIKQAIFTAESYIISAAATRHAMITVNELQGKILSTEEKDTVMRFAKVFEQAYIRFLDLQNAEAQAREGQVQLALERVRARTMAMQKSDELADLSLELVKQVQGLGVSTWFCAFNIYDDDDPRGSLEWGSNGQGTFPRYRTPREGVFLKYLKAGQQGETLLVNEIGEDECPAHYEYLCTLPGVGDQLLSMKAAGIPFPTSQIDHVAFFQYGYIIFITYEPVPESHAIFKRFAKVFEQAYTRFLDLQKAEAQAREAQIEAALERVRSRGLGMQTSEELQQVIRVVMEQFAQLKINVDHAGFVIDYQPKGDWHFWIADAHEIPSKISHPFFDSVWANQFNAAKEQGLDQFITYLDFEEKNKFYTELLSYVPGLPEESKKFYFECAGLAATTVLFDDVSLYIENFSAIPYSEEENKILKRFGKVFQQTYTRFLDLKKAEAQTREARIEAALEKVRSQSIGMQNSDDLNKVAATLMHQMGNLGWQLFGSAIVLCDTEKDYVEQWHSVPGLGMIPPFIVPVDTDHIHAYRYEQWRQGKAFFSVDIPGDYIQEHFEKLYALPKVKPILEGFARQGLKAPPTPPKEIDYGASFKYGYLLMSSLEPFAEANILPRFAQVFEQAYTRFLDLKKAEAQAREAQVETALERVRSRTLAMQKSGELADTAAVLFKELITLGIEPNRLYIGIIHNNSGDIEAWATDEEGGKVNMMVTLSSQRNASVKKMFDGWAAGDKTLVIDMQAEELKQYVYYLAEELGAPVTTAYTQTRRVQTIAYFSKGLIGMASPEPQPAETRELLQRFASAFNLTFTRFNDLQIAEAHAVQAEQDLIAITDAKQKAETALAELQATQRQLIQSEKMASLGELTAGIAHEIQNPLNFVNNFSEVSSELLDELKLRKEELKIEDPDVNDLLEDIRLNLEKINHHGKRADGIVKGMLQHSRSSSGQKEPTDINALCDEYLRLAYHGLRAKDKSFNAKIETDFDPAIGKIKAVPQDIGRVMLNLVNNAFQAVGERQHASGKDYRPVVSLKTEKKENFVVVQVSDNGNGVPESIREKIFQPFFTTKPTGQGTGLGLSLAYDIIKAHGGELRLEAAAGQGSTFVIKLPAN